jgi:hypothetical protein
VKDACNNSVTIVQTINVGDITAPVITYCPPGVSAYADSAQCYATGVVLGTPTATDNCSTVTITNNAPAQFPIGKTIVTWTVNDACGNTATCTQTVTVTDLLPVLVCPANISVPADYQQLYASNVTVPPPTYSDNCPNPTLTWTMTGATTATGSGDPSGINIVSSTYTFNVGVTTITYTLTDIHSHTVNCSFTVTVVSKPEIECQPGINVFTDAGVCSATLDPGFPVKISGAEPITYSWTMTGATIGSGTGQIGNYTFNLGTTTITWKAENISGYVECIQLINVSDNIKPTFIPSAPLVVCVENLISAVFDPAKLDINTDRPEYYNFVAGNTSLDINPLTFTDNCNLSCPVEIRWKIIMNDGTQIPPLPAAYQTGQPSAYGSDIRFSGDGITFTNVVHTITYWIVDCNGNVSDPMNQTITVKPRPNL